MREASFVEYLLTRPLNEATRRDRVRALKRLERVQGIDLDEEFDRDGLASLTSLFRYTAEDSRSGRSNPTRINVGTGDVQRQLTWYRMQINEYHRFRSAAGESGAEELPSAEDGGRDGAAEIADAISRTFDLESDLQRALRSNLDQLEAGLVAADGGAELHVEGGFIDILARDRAGAWTVIELKAGTSRPAAVAQILAYMSCVEAEKGGPVRGILIAADHDKRVVLAARAVANLALKTYRYRFDFQ